MVISKTPDGETPSVENICDDAGLTGEAWDICNAYCEAQDCDINTEGKKSCAILKRNFEKVTGSNILPCEIIEEACCLPDGSCSDVISSECDSLGGSAQGELTDCTGVVCEPLEACCLPDRSCEDMGASECDSQGGTQHEGVVCANTECDWGQEACCLPDGSCSDVIPSECDSIGGLSQGELTDCADVLCGS
jgi:hypothetical protein